MLPILTALFSCIAHGENPVPQVPAEATARLVDTLWNAETIKSGTAALAEELVANVEGFRLSTDTHGLVQDAADDLKKADILEVCLVASIFERPWLRAAEIGWHLDILDEANEKMAVEQSTFVSSVQFDGASGFGGLQLMQEAMNQVSRRLTSAYKLRVPDGQLRLDPDRLLLRFTVSAFSSQKPPSQINGRLGVRVPIQHALFEFPGDAGMTENETPKTVLKAGDYELAMLGGDESAMVVKLSGPNLDAALRPEFSAIAADGRFLGSVESLEASLGEADSQNSRVYVLKPTPMPPVVRVRIPTRFAEDSVKLNLTPYTKDSPPRYLPVMPQKPKGLTAEEARNVCKVAMFRDGSSRATLSVHFQDTPAAPFAEVDYSALNLDIFGPTGFTEPKIVKPTRANNGKLNLILRQLDEATFNVGKFMASGGTTPLPMTQTRTFRSATGTLKVRFPARFETIRVDAPHGVAFDQEVAVYGNRVFLKPVLEGRKYTMQFISAYDATGKALLRLSDSDGWEPGSVSSYAGTIAAVELTQPVETTTLLFPIDLKADVIGETPIEIASSR